MPPYCHQVLWHNGVYDEFVRQVAPEVYSIYNTIKTPTERSDFVRMLAIYHYGGFYADNDVYVRRPLEEWALGQNGVGVVVGIEIDGKKDGHDFDTLAQYVFAARPHHPIFRDIVQTIISNLYTERVSGDVHYRNYNADDQVGERTGPRVFARAFEEYFRRHGTSLRKICERKAPYRVPNSDVLVLPQQSFRSWDSKAEKVVLTPLTMAVHDFKGVWKTKKGE